MGLKAYYPEMGEEKPVAKIEASLSHYGKHYFLYTALEIKGRGVEYLGTYRPQDLTESGQYKVGWNKYQVTIKAFEKIKSFVDVSYEILLD